MTRTVIRLIGGLALAAVTAMGVSPVWERPWPALGNCPRQCFLLR